jgi:threonine dehydrogenase-like Zn-dependent dehydrogenase
MKALVYTGAKKVELRDVPEPSPKSGQVKLKIRYCGICGSDIGIFAGTHPRAKAPLILGHEFLGILMEDGKKFKKGDRVATFPLLSCGKCFPCRTGNSHVCRSLGLIGIDTDGGIAEYACVDEDMLFKVPGGVSDKAAAVIEPLAVIVHSLRQARFQGLDNAAVIGAGPIGTLTGMMLMHMGASKVWISDVNARRLERVKSLGMIPVDVSTRPLEKAVKDETDGEGADVVFECSGAADAAMQATDIARVRGIICITATHKTPHEVNLQAVNFKEQTLVGTRVYTKEEFGMAAEYSARFQNNLEKVVSHVLPFKDAPGVFDMIAAPENGTIKVLIDCQWERP